MVLQSENDDSSSHSGSHVEVEIDQEGQEGEQQENSSANEIEIFQQQQDDEEEEESKNDQDQYKFTIGENIDCIDTAKKWLNAEVVAVRPGNIRVHFSGWSEKYDEWIEVNSNRILKQWRRGQQIKLNNRIDVFHVQTKQWYETYVIAIIDEQSVKIHYVGYQSKYDEIVQLNDQERVDEVGTHSKGFGGARTRARNPEKFKNRIRELKIRRELKFMQDLKEQRKLAVKIVGGDGNCLFRAASDQMYGCEEFHELIRSACLDYIEYERTFFEDYIDEDFQSYLNRKRQLGEWGDDIELQAMSEIYNRPIEVYAYSSTPMRTFHETNFQNVEPIRLSFHGQCHYNSVRKINQSIMNEQIQQIYSQEYQGYLSKQDSGKLEAEALQNSKQRQNSTNNNDLIEQQVFNEENQKCQINLTDAIKHSRKEFEAVGKRDMESALEESLRSYEENEKVKNEQEMVDMEIKTSIDAFMEAEEEKLIIDQMKKETRIQNEREDVEGIFQQSQVQQIEEEELRQALKESQTQNTDNNHHTSQDPMNNPTIAAVVATGLPLDLVVQAYTIYGDFPDLIINYIYETYY